MADSRDMALSVIPESSVPDFYADSAGFGASPVSVFLEFQQAQQGPPGSAPPVRPLVQIHMSPHFAKLLATILTRNMEVWEQTNGRLQLPEELLEQLGPH
jgi:hypothetical protein